MKPLTVSSPPRFRPRSLAAGLVAALMLGAAQSSVSQIPGSELPTASRARSEYLETTYADVKLFLAEWHESIQKNDIKRLSRLFTTDGLFAPVEGYYVQGRESIADTLTGRSPRVRGYHASLIDFTASGGLAYYLGRMGYRLDDGKGGGRDINGTFVMVLYQEGRRWRVRSYIERTGEFD